VQASRENCPRDIRDLKRESDSKFKTIRPATEKARQPDITMPVMWHERLVTGSEVKRNPFSVKVSFSYFDSTFLALLYYGCLGALFVQHLTESC